MAELGIIASVIQIADTGFRLSMKLYTFGEVVASADRSVIFISKDVSHTSVVLKELGQILDRDKGSTILSENAVQTAESVVKECSEVFQMMESILVEKMPNLRETGGEKVSKALVLLQKLRWPYLQPKLRLLQGNLDRLKSTIPLMLNVITYARQVKKNTEAPSVIADQRCLIEDLARSNQDYIRKFEDLKLSIETDESKHDGSSHSSTLNDWNPQMQFTAARNADPTGVFINAQSREIPPPENSSPNMDQDGECGPTSLSAHFMFYLQLISKLYDEVNETKYMITPNSRSSLTTGVRHVHDQEMQDIVSTYGIIKLKDLEESFASSEAARHQGLGRFASSPRPKVTPKGRHSAPNRPIIPKDPVFWKAPNTHIPRMTTSPVDPGSFSAATAPPRSRKRKAPGHALNRYSNGLAADTEIKQTWEPFANSSTIGEIHPESRVSKKLESWSSGREGKAPDDAERILQPLLSQETANWEKMAHIMEPEKASVTQPQKRTWKCWDHHCNGRDFSTREGLLRHKREESGNLLRSVCDECALAHGSLTRKTASEGPQCTNVHCKWNQISSPILTGKFSAEDCLMDVGSPLPPLAESENIQLRSNTVETPDQTRFQQTFDMPAPMRQQNPSQMVSLPRQQQMQRQGEMGQPQSHMNETPALHGMEMQQAAQRLRARSQSITAQQQMQGQPSVMPSPQQQMQAQQSVMDSPRQQMQRQQSGMYPQQLQHERGSSQYPPTPHHHYVPPQTPQPAHNIAPQASMGPAMMMMQNSRFNTPTQYRQEPLQQRQQTRPREPRQWAKDDEYAGLASQVAVLHRQTGSVVDELVAKWTLLSPV